MNSPLESLRARLSPEHHKHVIRFAHLACAAIARPQLYRMCLAADLLDGSAVGPCEALYERTVDNPKHFRDLQNICKQYIREHL